MMFLNIPIIFIHTITRSAAFAPTTGGSKAHQEKISFVKKTWLHNNNQLGRSNRSTNTNINRAIGVGIGIFFETSPSGEPIPIPMTLLFLRYLFTLIVILSSNAQFRIIFTRRSHVSCHHIIHPPPYTSTLNTTSFKSTSTTTHNSFQRIYPSYCGWWWMHI